METKTINKNVNQMVDIVVKDNVTSLVEKGSKIETEQQVYIDEKLTAPLKKGDVVGKLELHSLSDGELLGSSDLVVKEDVVKSPYMDYLKKIGKLFILR